MPPKPKVTPRKSQVNSPRTKLPVQQAGKRPAVVAPSSAEKTARGRPPDTKTKEATDSPRVKRRKILDNGGGETAVIVDGSSDEEAQEDLEVSFNFEVGSVSEPVILPKSAEINRLWEI